MPAFPQLHSGFKQATRGFCEHPPHFSANLRPSRYDHFYIPGRGSGKKSDVPWGGVKIEEDVGQGLLEFDEKRVEPRWKLALQQGIFSTISLLRTAKKGGAQRHWNIVECVGALLRKDRGSKSSGVCHLDDFKIQRTQSIFLVSEYWKYIHMMEWCRHVRNGEISTNLWNILMEIPWD